MKEQVYTIFCTPAFLVLDLAIISKQEILILILIVFLYRED